MKPNLSGLLALLMMPVVALLCWMADRYQRRYWTKYAMKYKEGK